MKTIANLTVSTAMGAVVGFLTRPCCVIPAALSLGGVSTAGVGEVLASHRAAFLSAGSVMLTASLGMTFLRAGGWFGQSVTVAMTLIAFALWMRVF